MQKPRILVVEDERIVSLDVQSRLKSLGYEVVDSATTGEDAIRKAGSLRPDLVLMDIMLDGEMDGIQAAEIIRGRFGIAVIYLTAYADPGTLERAKVTEPFGYILKPFEERELHGHIEIALYKHRMERRLKESEERYALATEAANDGIWDWDLQTEKVYFSVRWKAMLGYGEDEIGDSPKEWFSRLHPADRAHVKERLSEHVRGRRPHFECEYRILCKDGTYRWMLSRGMVLRSETGKASRLAGSQTDITERKIYDPITSLPNRTLFLDRIQTVVEGSRRHTDPSFAVLCLNLAGLSAAVDGLGGTNRDELLTEIAGRFRQVLEPGDTIARLEEDTFGIVLTEIRSASRATEAATALQQALVASPLKVGNQELYVELRAGIALGMTGYTRAEDVVRDAGTAMHRAKTSDGTRFEIFDEDMRARMADRIKWDAELRRAVERNELDVYYQPIVAMENGRIVGFEALARWPHREGLLLPKDFIPLAEETDLILAIEHEVLKRALGQMREWKEKAPGRLPLTVSVNLSAKHYAYPGLVEEILEILDANRLEPHFLVLEITESALLASRAEVGATLSKLDALDIRLAMDDFGTGYSSLSYLHQFPIKTLKIDQSFVRDLGSRSQGTKIVQTIIGLGKSLGIDVTAEGVENVQQIVELREFGCKYVQGFAFSTPLPGPEATRLLVNDVSWLSDSLTEPIHRG